MSSKQAPVLFLDIDGVLNTLESCRRQGNRQFVREAAHALRRVLEETSCRIVLSSSWGKDPAMNIEACFVNHGLTEFTHRIIGATPLIQRWDGCSDEQVRAAEIEQWLHDGSYRGRIAILDDFRLPGPMNQWLVLVSDMIGLTEAQSAQAIGLLLEGPEYRDERV